MHETRVTVDKLLADGKIEEAESYMEKRRQVFWDNGYLIRKLNQAYFAFHGAYADVPGGAAGEDPVGPAVRALRAQSASLADFVNTIAWMTSFQQLQQAIKWTIIAIAYRLSHCLSQAFSTCVTKLSDKNYEQIS